MSELFYNFCIGGENRGYYYLKQTDDSLFSQAKFLLENGEIFTNTFELRLDHTKVLAYKYRKGAWVDFSSNPANTYPTSAYLLLLPKVGAEPYRYTAVLESDGSVLGETVLSLRDSDIVETRAARETRRFTMKNGVPETIDWGGPVSRLCKNADEAVKGSHVLFAL